MRTHLGDRLREIAESVDEASETKKPDGMVFISAGDIELVLGCDSLLPPEKAIRYLLHAVENAMLAREYDAAHAGQTMTVGFS